MKRVLLGERASPEPQLTRPPGSLVSQAQHALRNNCEAIGLFLNDVSYGRRQPTPTILNMRSWPFTTDCAVLARNVIDTPMQSQLHTYLP